MRKVFAVYFRSLMYFITITSIAVLATLMLHEMGHAFFGALSGCENIKVIAFDSSSDYPYTEMLCDDIDPTLVGLSGYFLIFPFALFFLFLPRVPEKMLVIVVIGFNIMISAWDIMNYLGQWLFAPIFIAGSIVFLIGELLFMEEEGVYLEASLISHAPGKKPEKSIGEGDLK